MITRVQASLKPGMYLRTEERSEVNATHNKSIFVLETVLLIFLLLKFNL